MILFFWSGGGPGGNGVGAVMGILSFIFMMLVPSIVNILYLEDEAAPGDAARHEGHPTTSPETEDPTASLGFYTLLVLQLVVPFMAMGCMVTALTDDRVRRFLRLESLANEQRRPGTRRDDAAAVAAKIRKLPLMEYKSRRDLEHMSIKELVAYRNEARKKGYKAIHMSTDGGRVVDKKEKADLLQSREDAINEIAGLPGDEEEDDICSICFAQYESNDILRVLRCGHVFHADCGDLWFVRNQTCPLCKAAL